MWIRVIRFGKTQLFIVLEKKNACIEGNFLRFVYNYLRRKINNVFFDN